MANTNLKEKTNLTEKQIDNRVKKIRELDAQIKELEAAKNSVKDEIKVYMTDNDFQEIKTATNIIRYKEVSQDKLDSKGLKEKFPDIYKTFAKVTTYMRFSIN